MKTKNRFHWKRAVWDWLKVLPAVALIAVPLSVVLADGGVITRTSLYTDVWWGTFMTWLFVSLIGAAITGVITAIYNMGCGVSVLIIGLLVFGLGGGYLNSNAMATGASSSDYDAMVIEKATYVEKLLGVFVRTDQPTYTCSNADTDWDVGAEAATGCRNVTRVSYCDSYDSKGRCTDTDYRWYPWFDQEVGYTADLNIYQNGHVVFADHCAPPSWQTHLLGHNVLFGSATNLPDQAKAGVDFCYEVPADWARADTAVKNHELLPGVVYHKTLNWVNADPETVFRGSTRLVPEYQNAGLMPTILPITNSRGEPYEMDIFGNTSGSLGYDFNIVQFLGDLHPSAEFQSQLQRAALLWAGTAGPKLKANLMLNLAYARQIPNPSQWINTTKAHLMDNSVYGKKALAMNLAIWNCGVSDDETQILWCQMETGAFQDNVELKLFVSQMPPFPFAPQALFGTLTGGFVLDPQGKSVIEDPEWDDRQVELAKTDISFTGGAVNDAMYGTSSGHKFVKVSKDVYADKQYIIRPDADQIQRIKDGRGGSTFFSVVGLWFLIVVFAAGVVSKRHD